MLPRERGEQILADHAAGKSVREIARAYGHSPGTVRTYVNGLRTPGEPAARADSFSPFIAYCRKRLADDPHLRTHALGAELACLGLDGSIKTLYRSMERHGIRAHTCPDCHPASMSGYSLEPGGRPSRPSPLPVPVAPVAGEALESFLRRLAAVNRTTPEALLGILPPWFRIKARWHDDRWQPAHLTPWTGDAATALAVISGSAATAITAALPAFGCHDGQPVRAVTACRLCTASRRITQPVPVHLPAHHQVCLTHGIWLPGPGEPQFSVKDCPDILAAERQFRRLRRRCSIEQLIYARIQAPARHPDREWKRRLAALIESNPRQATESGPHALFQAAAYPEAVAAATPRPPKPVQSNLR